MGEKPEQIEKHIEQTRNELGDNLSELQKKVKNSIDWRAQFKERPMTMIGVAFGGGVLLSLVMGKNRSSSGRWSDDYWAKPAQPANETATNFESQSAGFNQPKGKPSDVWENIKGAVVGLAASKASEYLHQVVPGFQEQYRKVATKREASGANGNDQPPHNVVT